MTRQQTMCFFDFDERSDTCRACDRVVECRRRYRALVEPPKADDALALIKAYRKELVDRAREIAVGVARGRLYVCGPDVEAACKADIPFMSAWEKLKRQGYKPDWRLLGVVFRTKGFRPYHEPGQHQQKAIRQGSRGRPAACWVYTGEDR